MPTPQVQLTKLHKPHMGIDVCYIMEFQCC